MKKLEELGISPAPWSCDTVHPYAWIASRDSCDHQVVRLTCKINKRYIADARLIAASPELYEALAAIVSRLEAGDVLTKGNSVTDMVLDYAKKALAKAAGESEEAK